MVEQQNIDWDYIRSKIPYKKNPEEKLRRRELWKCIDINKNKIVSLAEMDKALRDAFGLADSVFDCKPAINRAFHVSKNYCKAKHEKGDDYIERKEFRVFLYFLRQYFEYYQAFARISTDDDRRIDLEEFVAAKDMIELWTGKTLDDPEATFNEIDKNGGGKILFDEFVDWASKVELDLEDDDSSCDEKE